MIYQDIEFHNVDRLERVAEMPGLKLCRFPEQFSRQLGTAVNRNGRFRAERPHGCEIRFVTGALFFDLALTAAEHDIEVMIYCGDYLHRKETLKAGQCTVLHVEASPVLALVETEQLPGRRFDFKVWRIQFGLNGYVWFHYLNTFGDRCRPPKASEKPDTVWLAYGSSITCGSAASVYSNAYVNQAAELLGYDVLNKGLSGSCYCEGFAADYLAGAECDILTLELGVNMAPTFEEAEMEDRMAYLMKQLYCSPAKEIYILDIFPNKGLIYKDRESAYYRHYRSFKEIVGRLAATGSDARVRLVRGEEVLTGLHYLSTDLLHPSDQGHIEMGRNLAAAMGKS